MVHRIALLSVAATALAVATLPHAAAAADYYDEGRGPGPRFSQDDLAFDGDRAVPDHRRDMDRFAPRGAGPVVFDEREPGRRFGGPGHDGPDGGRVFAEGPDDGFGPVGGPRFGRPLYPGDGGRYRGAPDYRAVAPVYRAVAVSGEVFDDRAGLPDVGCTIQQSQSVTPAGWRKIVTHRTCYRR